MDFPKLPDLGIGAYSGIFAHSFGNRPARTRQEKL
jgi:hypothetical protein